MDYYFAAAAVLFVTQMAHLSALYTLEIEVFKQKLRYFVYKGYLNTQTVFQRVSNYFFPVKPTEKREKEKIELYENKYKQKFNDLDQMPLTEEDFRRLKQNILFEHTPNGNVIIRYDVDKKTFEYYSDKTIPFRFLETVSRKYVSYFKCKCIYGDNRYIYLGKIANFSLLQKPDKRLLNKKLNLSFKEYKNMKT